MTGRAATAGLIGDERGSTVIEMALVVPFIVLMLMGTMILGAGYITDSRLSRFVAAATARWMDEALRHGPGSPLPKSFDGHPVCSALLGFDTQNDPMVFAAGNPDCAPPKGPDIFLDDGEAELMVWATGPVFGFGGYHEKMVVWRVTIPGFGDVKSGNLEQRGSPSVTAHKYVNFTGGDDGGAMNAAYAPSVTKGNGGGNGNADPAAVSTGAYQVANSSPTSTSATVPTSTDAAVTPGNGNGNGGGNGNSNGGSQTAGPAAGVAVASAPVAPAANSSNGNANGKGKKS